MRNPISILLGLLIILSSGTFVSAQGGNREGRILPKNQRLQSSYLIQLRDTKWMAEYRLNNLVGDIARAVELNETQSQKMRIAAKGAVGSYLEKQTEVMVEKAKKAGFKFDPTGEIPAGTKIVSGRSALGRQLSVFKEIENEKIWLSSIDKILTDENREKLDAWRQARIDYREKAAVDLFVARVDALLLLSAEQREQLHEVMKNRYAKVLANKLESRMANRGTVFVRGGQNGGNQEGDSVFAEIFSEHQLEQWNKSFGSEIRNLETQAGNQ